MQKRKRKGKRERQMAKVKRGWRGHGKRRENEDETWTSRGWREMCVGRAKAWRGDTRSLLLCLSF